VDRAPFAVGGDIGVGFRGRGVDLKRIGLPGYACWRWRMGVGVVDEL